MNLIIDRTLHCLPRLGSLAVAFGLLLGGTPAFAADDSEGHPATDALQTYKDGPKRKSPVANRFFAKERRLEISPTIGYVTNNPFAQRYVGSVQLGYHVSETFSLQFQGMFSPDAGEGDLKNLVPVLLERARAQANNQAGEATGTDFQQPLDKLVLAGSVSAAWAPIYGKINLVGETVLNFDLYLLAGVGAIVKNNYVAEYGQPGGLEEIVELTEAAGGTETLPSGVIGIGQNYFVNQTLAVKIDARANFWVDNRPQYNPDEPVTGNQLFNNFMASAGVAVFFPKMKPRLYDF